MLRAFYYSHLLFIPSRPHINSIVRVFGLNLCFVLFLFFYCFNFISATIQLLEVVSSLHEISWRGKLLLGIRSLVVFYFHFYFFLAKFMIYE